MANSIQNISSTSRREIGIKDFISITLRRKYLILLSFVSVVASTYFYVYNIKEIYESYSTLVIEEQNDVLSTVMNVRGRSLSYYQGILNSRTYLELVLDSIGIDVFKRYFENINEDNAREYIKNSMQLRKTNYTSFLRLNVRAISKELAFFIASTGTDIFQKRCQEVESEESRRTTIEINKQLNIIKSKLEKAEYDYRSYKDKTGNINEGLTVELKTLQEAQAEIVAQLGVKEADLKAERRELSKLETTLTPGDNNKTPEIRKLRTKLRDLEKEKVRLENLGIRLSSTSTIDREIKEIERQLLQYKKNTDQKAPNPGIISQWQRLRKSVVNKETELALLKSRLSSYNKAIKSYKKDNPNILSHSLELLRLKRTKEVYDNLYNILLEKAEEQRIVSASSSAGIKIVDIATMPTNPISKNEIQYYLVGILLGLALGFGIAFILEFNDTTIKSNDDIERYVKLPVLGAIPHITFSKKNEVKKLKRSSAKSSKIVSVTQYPKHLINFAGDESITAEAYRSLRTNLSFVSPDNPPRCLLITSAGPSEGKSLTISNLALSYAQMGKKTLLIDCDLRRPVAHHIFNLKRENGLSDLFTGNASYNDVIKSTERENFYVITAGMFTPNPTELIASKKMEQHIDYFRENFDMVFFDTPPIVAVTDAALLGTKLDGILLVIRSNKTSREVAQKAVSNLENVGIQCLGVVLNDINLSHRYSSYGYYKYYYHYYKSKT